MGTVGNCYNNSMMESFWGTLQLEVLDRKTRKIREELAVAIFELIECWYNPQRRHSRLGMLSPSEFEARNPERPSPHDERGHPTRGVRQTGPTLNAPPYYHAELTIAAIVLWLR